MQEKRKRKLWKQLKRLNKKIRKNSQEAANGRALAANRFNSDEVFVDEA